MSLVDLLAVLTDEFCVYVFKVAEGQCGRVGRLTQCHVTNIVRNNVAVGGGGGGGGGGEGIRVW